MGPWTTTITALPAIILGVRAVFVVIGGIANALTIVGWDVKTRAGEGNRTDALAIDCVESRESYVGARSFRSCISCSLSTRTNVPVLISLIGNGIIPVFELGFVHVSLGSFHHHVENVIDIINTFTCGCFKVRARCTVIIT